MLNNNNKFKFKKEFRPEELSQKAYIIYSNSDFVFYQDGEKYYYADNNRDNPSELGTIESVNDFLESMSE